MPMNRIEMLNRVDLENHINDIEKHDIKNLRPLVQSIGNVSNLSVLNKANIVTATNEIFQDVTNGKKSIVNAIKSKGVSSSEGSSFEEISNSIRGISRGIASAKGISATLNNNYSYSFKYEGSSKYFYKPYIIVSGLGFRAKNIALINTTSIGAYISIYSNSSMGENVVLSHFGKSSSESYGYSYLVNSTTSSAYVNDDGFLLPIDHGNTGEKVYWYAYE